MNRFASTLLLLILIVLAATGLTSLVRAGSFVTPDMFFDGFEPATIVHPPTFIPGVPVAEVRVCIDPTSPNKTVMQAPLERAIATWNALTPTQGSCANCVGHLDDIPSSGPYDFETAALHELGHCVFGLAHPDWEAPDPFIPGNRLVTWFTDSSDGTVPSGPGTDLIRGTFDDERDSAVNLHWYWKGINNPLHFDAAAPIDQTTIGISEFDWPVAHRFAASLNIDVAGALGAPGTEAIMFSFPARTKQNRALSADDVTTVRYAMSGLDELASTTADNYTVEIIFQGASQTACDASDVVVRFTDQFEVGRCAMQLAPSVSFPGHFAVRNAEINFTALNEWDFGEQTSNLIFLDGFESGDLAGWSQSVP